MYITPLPITANLEQYQQQVDSLYTGCMAREKDALQFMYNHHPQWWRKTEAEMLNTPIAKENATNALAWFYAFTSWETLMAWVAAITEPGAQAARFEEAVDTIVAGDIPALKTLLHNDPSLINARSLRSHHSTLLHYTGTNGVEGYRQRYPPNAVEVLQLLLAEGAEVDAQAGMYGGGSTTLGLVATSIHPAKAGIMTTLLDILLKAGAVIDQPGAAGNGHYAINGCLANGRPEAADYLARHGALLDLEGAAGVGRLDIVKASSGKMAACSTMLPASKWKRVLFGPANLAIHL
ncbi:hypothetical protein [Paraflavitalea speifideaquila]|uniref:hypothetical protein n=1 Tax=Paraflavitalea speifideaquila TaxID=3076558 RepID=UPI0028E3CFB9|nr:hypothetical protein [Paraflavitalea speifideiaquila]